MGSAFHQLCPRYSGTLTPTAPTAIRLWDTFTFYTNKLYSNELTELFKNNDFILFTEVWSNDRCDLSVNGFSIFQLNRVDKKTHRKAGLRWHIFIC